MYSVSTCRFTNYCIDNQATYLLEKVVGCCYRFKANKSILEAISNYAILEKIANILLKYTYL